MDDNSDNHRILSEPECIGRTPTVYAFVAPNPGPKTLSGTNTYVVVGDDRQGYLIDPGPVSASHAARLEHWARDTRITIRAILITHSHPDHAQGAAALKTMLRAPIYGSRHLNMRAARSLLVDRQFTQDEVLSLGVSWQGILVVETAGHTDDHVAFYQLDAKMLFAGDLILGRGSTLVAPPEGNMKTYLDSLQRISTLELTAIAPGHGPFVRRPYAKIQEYIEHRKEREMQIVNALSTAPGTVSDIVDGVYIDVEPAVRSLASGSVRAHLAKLEQEGKVARHGDVYTLIGHKIR